MKRQNERSPIKIIIRFADTEQMETTVIDVANDELG